MRLLVVGLVLLGNVAVPAVHAQTQLRIAPPVIAPIIRHFEPPPTPFAAGHRGIDLGMPAGTVVRASAAGVVTFAGQVGGDLFVTLDHGDLRTTYSFLSRILVARGASIAQDEPIALSGAGHDGADQPHLHFGIRQGEDYLDPEPLLLETIRLELWRVTRLAA